MRAIVDLERIFVNCDILLMYTIMKYIRFQTIREDCYKAQYFYNP